MPKIRYMPVPGGRFVAPTLEPGAVIEVSPAEAECLLETGAFERVEEQEPRASEVTSDSEPQARPRRGRA